VGERRPGGDVACRCRFGRCARSRPSIEVEDELGEGIVMTYGDDGIVEAGGSVAVRVAHLAAVAGVTGVVNIVD
jgi:hypothetical protein